MRSNWVIWSILLIISAVYLLVFSYATSPLYDSEGLDSMMFKLISIGWRDGKIPFIDTFENKGPYLHLVYLSGLLISHKYGLLILQTINLWISLVLSYKIGRIFSLSTGKIFAGIAIMLVFYIQTIAEGCLSEEWSLVFLFVPTYLFLKFIYKSESASISDHPLKWTFVYGACAGVLAFIRPNNACIVAGIVVTGGILCVKQKDWCALWKNALAFVGGFVLTLLPVVIYYAWHQGLADLWHVYVVFNIHYMNKWGAVANAGYHNPVLEIIMNTMMMWPIILLCIMVSQKERSHPAALKTFFITSTVICYLVLFRSVGYSHYFTIFLPLVLVFIFITLKLRPLVATLVILIALVPTIGEMSAIYLLKSYCQRQDDCAYYPYVGRPVEDMLLRNMPEEELGEVFSYGLLYENAVFVRRQQYPASKYVFFHNQYAELDPRVGNEIETYMRQAQPKWVMASKTEYATTPRFKAMIDRGYAVVDSVNKVYLYRFAPTPAKR